jgi:hypothetical protein
VVANEMIILGSCESHDSHPDCSGDVDRYAVTDEGACWALLPIS